MTTKTILLAVADPQVLIDVAHALGPDWETTSVASESDGIDQLDKHTFDAVLVDFNLGSPDASELMNYSLQKHPELPRFLLAYEADLALVAAKVDGTHQILPKPVEPVSLKSRVEEGVKDQNDEQAESNPAPETATPPSVPPIYSEVLKVLDLPDVTNEQVGELIARDAALAAEVLRLSKSGYMGLPRNITDPAEAVESLGLEAVRALVLALRFLAEHSHLKPSYLSIDKIWQHSTNVAQIARDLVLFETKDRALASQALAAGLLHDLGKVVLVTNFDDLYGRVHSLARKQPVPLWDIEKEMFGADHGEIGGCLVGMWNMPITIVDATALHHSPPLGEDEEMTPLAAVHIANVLEHQLRPNDECRVAPVISTAYLNQLGLLQRLPVWRAAYSNRKAANQQSIEELAEIQNLEAQPTALEAQPSVRTANQLAAPSHGTRTGNSGETHDPAPHDLIAPFRQKRWMYAGIAAVILLLAALWLRTQPDAEQSEAVYARTPNPHRVAATSNPAPAQPDQTAPASSEPVATASTANEPAANLPPDKEVEPASSKPEPASTPATAATSEIATNLPPQNLPPKEPARPEFRLSGIIYGLSSPSAIVNGKTVFVGDQIAGASVVKISPTAVTLLVDGQRKTYDLH